MGSPFLKKKANVSITACDGGHSLRCAIVAATADLSKPAPVSEFSRPMLEFAGSRGGSEGQTAASIDMEALEAFRASALSSVEIVDVLSLLLARPLCRVPSFLSQFSGYNS